MTNRFACTLLGAALMLAGATARAGTFNVTVTPLFPSQAWTGSTFAASNPTPVPLVQTLPTCNYTVSCDRVNVTVSNVTQAFVDANPDARVIFQIQWPDANGDFDMYVMDAADANLLTSSASSANPEVATLPLRAGTTQYTLRIVPYTVLPTDSYTGSVSLAVPAPPPPPPGGFAAAQYVPGTDVFSCNTHLTGIDANGTDFSTAAEPAVKFDPLGNAYVVSNSGLGLGIWRVPDTCGQRFTFLGSDLINGGGDGDVEAAALPNASGFYNIYTSSLHSTPPLTNFDSSVSYDGGQTFLTTPISDLTPLNDRQWNASYGRDIVLLSYRSANTGNQQFCVRARAVTGAPLVFGPSSPIYTDTGTIGPLIADTGTMVCDPRPGADTSAVPHAGPDGEGTTYHAFNVNGDQVWVAISRDFGTTWHDALVFQGAPGSSYDHIFTWCAVDRAGNVYVAFSDDHSVYYCVSADARHTDTPHWSLPVRVNNGDLTKAAIMPAMAAGSAGQVVFTWYGSPTATAHQADCAWRVFHARCQNALDVLTGGTPVIEQVVASDHVIHTGDACEGGTLGCPAAGSRNLLDDFEIDVNPLDGTSFITYTDDAAGQATYITRELAGKSAVAGKTVTDRTATCPVAVAGCTPPPPPQNGDPCTLPGVLVVPDRTGDEVPPNPQQDIRSVSIAEPLVAGRQDSLVFTIQVASLNPDSLPPNAFWRVIWGGSQWYVMATKCATASAVRYSYGTFTTGSVELGLADAGQVTPDGTIRITIGKSKVGQPQPGQQLIAVNADSRTVVGNCPGSPAGFAPVDTTGNGTYTLTPCSPVATTVQRFSAEPSGAGVELTWSVGDPTGIVGWNLYRAPQGEAAWTRLNTAPLPPSSPDGTFQWQDAPGPGSFDYRLTALTSGGAERDVADASFVPGVSVRTLSLAVVGANPFRDGTQIRYSLPARADVRLEVFSVTGQRVVTLVRGVEDAGTHTVPFSMTSGAGRGLGSGVYLVRLSAGGARRTATVIAVR